MALVDLHVVNTKHYIQAFAKKKNKEQTCG